MKSNTKPCKALALGSRKKGAGSLKNAGYTLLEMIVVVAILAVGLAIASMSINTIFSLEMKECTKELGSELGKEKVAAMTRIGDVYMRVYKKSDGVYIDKFENGLLVEQGTKIGKAKIIIEYYTDTSPDAKATLLDSDGIIIAFNKNDGSFKLIGDAWHMYDDAYNPKYPDKYYTKLVISSANNSRTIVLWPDTGKFTISG